MRGNVIKALIIFAKLFGFLISDVDCWKDKSTLCYQCRSKNTDQNPVCDKIYFKFLNSSQLDDIKFHCTRTLSDYCFTLEERIKDEIITTRGCSGPKDENGKNIGVGCAKIVMSDKKAEGRICYCDEDLCNGSTTVNNNHLMIFRIFLCLHLFLLKFY